MEKLDPRKVLTGSDGYISAAVGDGEAVRLVDVTAFNASLNVTNADHQVIGDKFIYAVNTGVSVAISITEGVTRDDVTIVPILEAYKANKPVYFTFHGTLDRKWCDGQESRQVFRNCVPDGTIGILNLTPGEALSRELAFRGNALPEILKYFTA